MNARRNAPSSIVTAMADKRTGDRHRTKNRVIRVSDEVWDAAKAKADSEGVTMAEVVRSSLVSYAGLPLGTRAVLGRADRQDSEE